MQIERARDDLLVAGIAAGTTIGLVIASRIGGVDGIGGLTTLGPIYVYFGYLFSRKGGPYGSIDTPRNWAIVTIGLGVAVLVSALI